VSPTSEQVTEREVRAAVEGVLDPELPVLTLADLGVLREVRRQGDRVLVRLTPTYLACPALGAIKDDVRRAVADLGLEAEVEVVLSPPWHPGLISARGRDRLARAGVAPPASGTGGATDLGMPGSPPVPCPRCGSTDVALLSPRGPTPCTSIQVCRSCREPFEKVRER
jgi:ring-1,2-phenylacetyl-CoA epoxidase subunit PaaD